MTPPPSFPVELSKTFKRSDLPLFDGFMKKLEETPMEMSSTLTVGGSVDSKKIQPRWIVPHAHRLFFAFSKETFRCPEWPVPRGVGNGSLVLFFPVEKPEWKNSNSELHIKFSHYEVKVKKTQIEILNLVEHKRPYSVEQNLSHDGIKARVREVKREKQRQTLGFLRGLIGQYGGKSDCQILKELVDIKYFDDRMIPLTPLGQTWFKKDIKRAYPDEHNVEPLTWDAAENLVSNMTLRDYAPAIADEQRVMNERLSAIESKLSSFSSERRREVLVKPAPDASEREWARYWVDRAFSGVRF